MLGQPKIKIARPGYDLRKGPANKDMALNTELTLLKLLKVKRVTSNQSVAHNVGYTPLVLFLRELSQSPKQIGHAISAPLLDSTNTVDSTNINFVKIAAGDPAIIAVVFADPFGSENIVLPTNKQGPILKVANNKVYSRYDSLKVKSSGTLTLNVPEWTGSAGDDTDLVTATFAHNLGYVPLFAPFVPAQTSLTTFYQWYWQWHNRSSWSTSTEYLRDDYIIKDGTAYVCLLYHTSSASTEPGTGASWETYWVVNPGGRPADIPSGTLDLNRLEEYKIVYGGATLFVDETVYVYATTTELVISYKRVDTGEPFGYSTFPARTVTLGYTIFYNQIDTDYDLLN